MMRLLAIGMGLLVSAQGGGCHCAGPNGPARDADVEAGEADAPHSDGDADADADRDGDVDGDQRDADAEGPDTSSWRELCQGAPSEWSWSPFECPPLEMPEDCCASCRPATCRDGASFQYDIWGDMVAYSTRGSIAVVDLSSGSDRIVLGGRSDGAAVVAYSTPAVGSDFLAAERNEYPVSGPHRSTVAAVRLMEADPTEMSLDSTDPYSVIGIELYGPWVTWRRQLDAGAEVDFVLHNIETGEERVLDHGTDGYALYHGGLWGDRVVWGTSRGELKEHRISTGETRVALAPGSGLGPFYLVSVWQQYAVYTSEGHGPPSTVYVVDLDSSDARPVSAFASRQDQGRVHGGRVVWTDFRGGGGDGGGMHVWVANIATGREYVLNPSSAGGSEPMIFDRTVIWSGPPAPGLPSTVWVTRIGDI